MVLIFYVEKYGQQFSKLLLINPMLATVFSC